MRGAKLGLGVLAGGGHGGVVEAAARQREGGANRAHAGAGLLSDWVIIAR